MTASDPAAAMPPRNDAIDLLRGLAIGLVVLHHIGLRIPLRTTAAGDVLPRGLLDALNYNGYEAVFAFFVISGFLIAGNSIRRWPRFAGFDLRAFYAMRFARIAPPLLALVALLTLLHALRVPDYVIQRPGQSLPGAVAAALGLYLNRYEGLTGYLPGSWDVLWSLSIEEVFYLAFPIACLVARGPRVLALLLVPLALSLPFSHAALAGNEIWQEKAYLPGMAAIATGVLTALLCHRRIVSARVARACLAIGTTGLLLIGFAEGWLWKSLGDAALLVLTGAVAACLVASTRHAGGPRTRLDALLAPLRSWGRLSYEIYLSHMFVVYGLVRLAHAGPAEPGSGLWVYGVALPLCWGLGRLIERGISIPARRALLARFGALPRAA
jgi:peptidoglycan/LPS O-acetylase OafA/YrhL